MIKISAIQNYLPMVDRPYLVHTETREVLTFSELVDRMAAGRTTVTKTDIVATMQLFVEELTEDLAMGYSVKLTFGSFYLCASGTFKELDQAFSYGDK